MSGPRACVESAHAPSLRTYLDLLPLPLCVEQVAVDLGLPRHLFVSHDGGFICACGGVVEGIGLVNDGHLARAEKGGSRCCCSSTRKNGYARAPNLLLLAIKALPSRGAKKASSLRRGSKWECAERHRSNPRAHVLLTPNTRFHGRETQGRPKRRG